MTVPQRAGARPPPVCERASGGANCSPRQASVRIPRLSRTTTEKIATAAGVSEPVLYRISTARRPFSRSPGRSRAATVERWKTETAHLSDPLARLHAISELYLDTTREHALEFGVMHRALLETDDEEVLAMLRALPRQ